MVNDFSYHDFVTAVEAFLHQWAIVSKLRRAQSEDARLRGLWQPSTGVEMTDFHGSAWRQEEGQDVAEYAVMLAVILAIAIGTIRLIGSHAGNVFASVGSAIQ